ncbi:MAG: UDP-N-acetylmuramoylalanine--D-glutamate ligase [Candidatus Poribacteria bacterium]|nr:MAG: UDP-N-acetylmuramoylalanine--D-glutamate ligase [Candidatus Poribacteria bacterium]
MSARLFPPETWQGVRVGVIGLGASGTAAARALQRCGARLILNDAQPSSQQAQIEAQLRSAGIAWEALVLGDHPLELLEAVERLIVSPGVPFDLPLLRAARERGLPTLGELELAYQLTEAPFVAVTGTKGKSTTTTLIGQMLEAAGIAAVVAGNIGTPLTAVALDTPPERWIVAEVSSFQLESVFQFRPRIGVVLNVTADHLDRHRSLEAYLSAKLRLTENQKAEDLLILNAQDTTARRFIERTRARIRRFSLEPRAEAEAFLSKGWLCLRSGGRTISLCRREELRVLGDHFVEDALAAALTAWELGALPEQIAQPLREFRGLPHAYELVAVREGVAYVDDSKATNLAAVLAAVRATPPESPIVLIFGGVDKGNDYTGFLPAVRGRLRAVVLLGTETERLEALFRGVVPTVVCRSMEAAVRAASRLARPGDTVLLSPGHASFDLFANWKERGDAFQRAVRNAGREQ